MKIASLFLIGFAIYFSIFLAKTEFIADWYFSFKWKITSFRLLSIGIDEPFVTTAFVGYMFLLLFAGINFGRARMAGVTGQHMLFALVTFCVMGLELIGYWQLYTGADSVIHLRAGLPLAAWALWLVFRMYGVSKKVPGRI